MEDIDRREAGQDKLAWYLEPYGMTMDIRSRWLLSAVVGVFIFLFLYIFRPFGIESFGGSLALYSLGFGAVTFVIVAIFHVGVRWWWLHHYDEREWRVYHEIALLSATMIIIGIGNYILSEQPWHYGWSLYTMLMHQMTTMAVGIFPMVGAVLLRQRRMARKYRDGSTEINKSRPAQAIKSEGAYIETIIGSTETDRLSLDVNDLLYIAAADNYVIVYYLDGDQVQQEMLRATMKNITVQLSTYSFILRSHKSYIVNLNRVERVSGNAQGYKLHLNSIVEAIPVSRSLNKKVRDELIAG